MKKKKKIIKVDTSIKVLRNFGKSFKYYFKNIIYIVALNLLLSFLITKFLMLPMKMFFSNIFQNIALSKTLYFSILFMVIYPIKVTLYGNTIYTMKSHGINDIKELLSDIIKRFLPTLGTLILYTISIAFFLCLFVLPGLIFFFYYYFAVYFCAVGDIVNKENNKIKQLNGASALGRSYTLVKGNLIRFITLTSLSVILAILVRKIIFNLLGSVDLFPNITANYFITLSIYDFVLISNALLFIKFQGIENDIIEDETNRNFEEQVKMNYSALSHQSSIKKK